MRKILLKLYISVLLFLSSLAIGQNNRVNTSGNIGWYNFIGTIKIGSKWGLHTEYQWRRDNFITDWQQSLLRSGVNYQINPRILLRAGYAWIKTFPYGEIPINVLGRDFTEHRIFEMIQLSHNEGIVNVSHRFMLEQRFVGRYTSSNITSEDDFPLLHRMRYMIRMQIPLKGREMKDNTPYTAFYDEIFIGFGKNVNASIFDQNRIGVLFGYRFNKNLSLEAGYLNQIIQFGRQINGQNIFQNNNGLIINANFTIDANKNGINN